MEIRYALIKNGIVENVIIADAEFVATIADQWDHIELLDTPEEQKVSGTGWSYDAVNGAFSAPPAESVTAPAPRTKLTKLEYMDRFTDAELAGIYAAAKQSVQVEIWLERFKLATEVDLSDPRTISGIQALEAAGLIAAGRSIEILAV